jgi:hypothetical protein
VNPVPGVVLQALERHPDVAGEAVDLVDHHHVEQAVGRILQEALEGGTTLNAVGARRLALVGLFVGNRPAPLLAVFEQDAALRIERETVDLFLAGDAVVDAGAPPVPTRGSSRAGGARTGDTPTRSPT